MGRDDHHGIGWRALVFYGVTSLVVLVVAALALHFFFERQSLRDGIAPEPLPNILVVTEKADDSLGAAWVTLLTEADFAPKLVTSANLSPTDGVLVLCDLQRLSPSGVRIVQEHLEQRRPLVLIGHVPPELSSLTGIVTEPGKSGDALKMGETVSPVLARVHPGHVIGVQPGDVALLVENAATTVDARWRDTARAAVAHRETANGARIVWFGFDPSRLHTRGDRHLGLMLRTAFRWAAGQPVSDGAAGSVNVARALAPSARVESRAMRFTFSVDRLQDQDLFSVRVTNKGKLRLQNPTVKFWLPPGTRKVELMGSVISRRGASLVPVEGENAVLITLPSLAPQQDRLMRLRATR